MVLAALVFFSGSGLCKVGFTGVHAPRSMFPFVDDRPKMLDFNAGVDQKNSYVDTGGMLGWFCLRLCSSCCASSLSSGCFLASIEQKYWRVFQVVNIPVLAQRLFPWSRRALDKVAVAPVMLVFPSIVARPWSLHRCSSWTRLWACLSWFIDRCCGPDSACSRGSAVAALLHGR